MDKLKYIKTDNRLFRSYDVYLGDAYLCTVTKMTFWVNRWQISNVSAEIFNGYDYYRFLNISERRRVDAVKKLFIFMKTKGIEV